jgi:uncharacterized protein (DUF1800 family)
MRKTLLCLVVAAAASAQIGAQNLPERLNGVPSGLPERVNDAPSVRGTRDIPNDAAAVEHALNRLAYGPRQGDIERVRQMGLSTWIEQQLNPSRVDDSALASRLPEITKPPDSATQQELQRFGRQQIQTLAAQKVLRSIYSERQLEEVLVDFWFNHFNVFAGKGRTSLFLPEYERAAIRPHVWGNFRDLLEATAKSPAMLFYLDNWLSVDPQAAERLTNVQRVRRGAQRPGAGQAPNQPIVQAAQQRRRGLNENYARELLELHTLGVDGGYTQKDIIEVARALTGWTIQGGRARRPNQDQAMMAGAGTFAFTPRMHDPGEKVVLGHTLKAGGGIEDGERVLDIVASHPSTAKHIATKLVRRFVSDNPPDALVSRVAARFTETGGNLREVVRAVITSPEFFAAEHRGAKTKTPLEFVASAVRSTGRQIDESRQLVNALQQLGMMPYMCQPPTGYDDEPETWINAGALVTRVNVAQRIAPAQAARIGGPEFQRR